MRLPAAPTTKWRADPEILQAFHDDMYAKLVQAENKVLELERRAIAWRFSIHKPDALDVTYVVSPSNRIAFSGSQSMPIVTLKSISYVVEDGVAVTLDSELDGERGLKEHLVNVFSEHSLRRILRGVTEPVTETVNVAQYMCFEGSISDQVYDTKKSIRALGFFEQQVMYAEQLIFAMSLPAIGLMSIRPHFHTDLDYTIKIQCSHLSMHPDVVAVVDRMDHTSRSEHYMEMSARAVALAYELLPVTADYCAILPNRYPHIVVQDLIGAGNPEYNSFDFAFHMRPDC